MRWPDGGGAATRDRVGRIMAAGIERREFVELILYHG
jgi:hypothetical protein